LCSTKDENAKAFSWEAAERAEVKAESLERAGQVLPLLALPSHWVGNVFKGAQLVQFRQGFLFFVGQF
jgi:hypothetical protein